MVLEATMICIDNSEWIRNGDYSPTLFDAQKDAVSLICGAKTQANPENTVGVLTMAGKGVRVLVTPTSDLGMRHGVEVGGEMNLAAGIQVAQLALKHRQNKKQQQRIIVFVGSFVSAAWSSISQADYMALRLGFITTHQLPFTYDFHNCMLRSMEEEFRDIVGIRLPLWIFAITCIVLGFHVDPSTRYKTAPNSCKACC